MFFWRNGETKFTNVLNIKAYGPCRMESMKTFIATWETVKKKICTIIQKLFFIRKLIYIFSYLLIFFIFISLLMTDIFRFKRYNLLLKAIFIGLLELYFICKGLNLYISSTVAFIYEFVQLPLMQTTTGTWI